MWADDPWAREQQEQADRLQWYALSQWLEQISRRAGQLADFGSEEGMPGGLTLWESVASIGARDDMRNLAERLARLRDRAVDFAPGLAP